MGDTPSFFGIDQPSFFDTYTALLDRNDDLDDDQRQPAAESRAPSPSPTPLSGEGHKGQQDVPVSFYDMQIRRDWQQATPLSTAAPSEQMEVPLST
ncbi:hypothetical protein IAR50_000222 [Cryptococcus sp. DSM 104548]